MTTSIDTNTLLSILGSGVRPIDPTGPASGGGPRISFDDLLARASSGASASPAAVTALPSIDHGLSEAQLSSIAVLAEDAERQGASTLAVLDGDRVLTVDVASRTITGVDALGSVGGGLVAGADMIARLTASSPSPLALPGSFIGTGSSTANLGLDAANINASLLAALSRSAG